MQSRDEIAADQNCAWPVSIANSTPVVLYFDFFASVRQGLSPIDFIDDPALKRDAVIKTFLETGADGFVIGRLPGALSYAAGGFPNRIRLPGDGLPKQSMWQFEENTETIYAEDYDFIARYGWNRFLPKLLPRFTAYQAGELPDLFRRLKEEGRQDLDAWQKESVAILCGSAVTAPFEVLTAGRTLFNFFEDIYLRPEKVKGALEAMLPDLIENAIETASFFGIPAVVITAHRSCGSLISPAHFEEFAFPYISRMVESFNSAGLNIMLHLDCDWTKNLSYFSDFPQGTIIHTDGLTDLAQARKIFKNRFILMGDVPALLLARGSESQVEKYCLELISQVGKERHFILSSGCDVPMDAQFENVLAMVKAAEKS